MTSKTVANQHLGRWVAGLLSVALTNGLGQVQAQSSASPKPLETNAPQMTVVPSVSQFNLNPKAAPIVPAQLRQSKQPTNRRGVIGRDERVPMTSRHYPWSTIGRIVGIRADGKTYSCTGALIAANVVLTNAHCVINPYTHRISRAIAFEPNLIGDCLLDKADRAFAKRAVYGTDFQDSSIPPHPKDWAVLEIDRPLGRKYGTLRWQPLPVSVLTQNPGSFLTIGYSGDFPPNNPGNTAGVHLGCSITGETQQVLTHNCDTTEGASGSPILGWIDNEVRIVGLISAEARSLESQAKVNFAVKVSRILEQLRDRKKP